MSQKEIGIDAFAVTVPFLNSGTDKEMDVINDVYYYRSKRGKIRGNLDISDEQKSVFKRIAKLFKILGFILYLHRICVKLKPDIIHAHAMSFCGIPSLIVGWGLKIPVYYEVRSLWMLPKDGRSKSYFHDLINKFLLKIEIYTINKSKKTFVINDSLKKSLIDYGIRENHLVVIRNAVNTSLIQSKSAPLEERQELSKIRFGYVGSITPYEGIPFLIRAIKEVIKTHDNLELVIYGSIRDSKEYRLILNEIEKLNLSDYVIYKGSISPSKINEAYEEIDIIVNPRTKNIITDTVTPLKPLEAMAYGKLFIGSDVGGIKELLKDCPFGILFKSDDLVDLISKLTWTINMNHEERMELIKKGQGYVFNQKSWVNNARIYHENYLNN